MPLGYIYKLESSFEDAGIYVGSTKDLNKRKIEHKYICNNPNSKRYNTKLYQYIREYGGFNNWFMLTIEEFEYEDKKELREREQYWIKELKADLNSKNAWGGVCNIVSNREYSKIYQRIHYIENKNKKKKIF